MHNKRKEKQTDRQNRQAGRQTGRHRRNETYKERQTDNFWTPSQPWLLYSRDRHTGREKQRGKVTTEVDSPSPQQARSLHQELWRLEFVIVIGFECPSCQPYRITSDCVLDCDWDCNVKAEFIPKYFYHPSPTFFSFFFFLIFFFLSCACVCVCVLACKAY